MAATSQPVALHRLLTWFGTVVASHCFAVNLLVVLVLAGVGARLLTGPGNASSRSSFAAELAQAAEQSIRSPQASS